MSRISSIPPTNSWLHHGAERFYLTINAEDQTGDTDMSLKVVFASLTFSLLILLIQPEASHAGDWRSKYNTGSDFQLCCGDKDCKTAAALGFPELRRHPNGSYDVRLNGYWIRYDFPAVHPSEDDNIWICYLDSELDPEPLCLFIPPGIV